MESSTHVKYLGILIDSFLNWNFHIDELTTKLSRAVGMLAKIRHYMNTKTLPVVYHGICHHYFCMVLKFGDKIINQSQKWKNYKIKH